MATRRRDDAATRRALRAALACAASIVTSPAAVRAAASLRRCSAQRGQQWFAIGDGTARGACGARASTARVVPARVDSEGVLAMRSDCATSTGSASAW